MVVSRLYTRQNKLPLYGGCNTKTPRTPVCSLTRLCAAHKSNPFVGLEDDTPTSHNGRALRTRAKHHNVLLSSRLTLRSRTSHSDEMSTARCYTCHTLRPLSDFPYRRKDSAISATSRLKRYICVVLQQPTSRSRKVGAIYQYRCVHPRVGACPKHTREEGSLPQSAPQVDVCEDSDSTSRLDRRRGDEGTGREVDVAVQIDVCEDRDGEYSRAKQDAIKRLRQCVDATESDDVSP